MQIRVERFGTDGDIDGGVVIDKSASTNERGVQVGRNFLDEHGFTKMLYSFRHMYKEMPRAGALVEILDSTDVSFVGQLEDVSITVAGMDSALPVSVTVGSTVERSLV